MSDAASASSQLLALQKSNDDRIVKQGGGNAALAFAKDVKQSLLFQYDWGELLSAAPLCISMMGSCYVAATSPLAAGMSLKGDGITFVKIKYPELRACLIQVSDTGRFAFIEAEKKMDLIASQASSIGQYLTQIGTYLAYLPAPDAAMNLNKKLNLLKEGSDNCLKYSQDIEKKFQEWLGLVCEVHQVASSKEERTSMEQKDDSITLAGLNVEQELTATSLKHADEAAMDMKANMQSSKEMFQKAADAIPGPLEAVGIQLVATLGQTVTTVISQGLPMLMAGPVGMIGAVMGGMGQQKQQASTDEGKRGKKNKKASSQLHVSAADPSDPAYRVATQVSVAITLLATAIGAGGKNSTGIDWTHLDPTPINGQAPKNGLTFIGSTISHVLETTEWTDGQASQQLKATLTQLNDVIAAIRTEVKKDGQLTSQKAEAASPVVKEWQESVEECQAKITQLVTTANSLPGAAPGSAPMFGKTPAAGQPADSSAANAALASAQQKAQITEQAYLTSQETYRKAAESRSKVEGELSRIKASLESLKLNQVKLDEVKKILVQCIGMVVQMKQQITNLVHFFSALSAMVEHVVKTQVKDFVDQIDTAKTCLIGNISLSDMSRQELYTTTLMVQAYFSLFNTIANMYKKISVEHIMPGVSLCDELSKSTTDPGATEQKLTALNAFTDSAQEAIKTEVDKAQKSITDTLEERVNSAQAVTKLLPPPSPAIKAAIEAGKDQVTSSVAAGIAERENPIVVASVSMDDI